MAKTNNELLTLAALAAGIKITWGKCAAHSDDYEYLGVTGPWVHGSGWNPIHNSGDAFELMTKLRINLEFDRENQWVDVFGGCISCTVEKYGSMEAATRMAIVRAAAYMGETPELFSTGA